MTRTDASGQDYIEERFSLSQEISNDWYDCASDLNAAARILFAAQGNSDGHPTERLGLPSSFNFQAALNRPVLLNSGFALELILKACLVRARTFDPKKHRIHFLVDLARAAEVPYTSEQENTLRIFTDSAIWAGRYPLPKDVDGLRQNEANWTSARKVEKFGRITVTSSDETKWPSFSNYVELWRMAEERYWEIEPKDPREFLKRPVATR